MQYISNEFKRAVESDNEVIKTLNVKHLQNFKEYQWPSRLTVQYIGKNQPFEVASEEAREREREN